MVSPVALPQARDSGGGNSWFYLGVVNTSSLVSSIRFGYCPTPTPDDGHTSVHTRTLAHCTFLPYVQVHQYGSADDLCLRHIEAQPGPVPSHRVFNGTHPQVVPRPRGTSEAGLGEAEPGTSGLPGLTCTRSRGERCDDTWKSL